MEHYINKLDNEDSAPRRGPRTHPAHAGYPTTLTNNCFTFQPPARPQIMDSFPYITTPAHPRGIEHQPSGFQPRPRFPYMSQQDATMLNDSGSNPSSGENITPSDGIFTTGAVGTLNDAFPYAMCSPDHAANLSFTRNDSYTGSLPPYVPPYPDTQFESSANDPHATNMHKSFTFTTANAPFSSGLTPRINGQSSYDPMYKKFPEPFAIQQQHQYQQQTHHGRFMPTDPFGVRPQDVINRYVPPHRLIKPGVVQPREDMTDYKRIGSGSNHNEGELPVNPGPDVELDLTTVTPPATGTMHVITGVAPATSSATTVDPLDPNFLLTFRSAPSAEAYAHRIMKLNITEDDVEEVRQNQPQWVRKIMKAILQPDNFNHADEHRGTGDNKRDLTDDEAVEYTRWQDANSKPIIDVLNLNGANDIVNIVESIAWQLLEKVLQIHTEGVRFSSFDTDTESKCSVRLSEAISLMDGYALVRYDIFMNPTCDAFARAPTKFKDRKINNLWVNLGKKKGKVSQTVAKKKTAFCLLSNYYPEDEIKEMKNPKSEGKGEATTTAKKRSKKGQGKVKQGSAKKRKSRATANGNGGADSPVNDDEASEEIVDTTPINAVEENVDSSELSPVSELSPFDSIRAATLMAPLPATPTRSTMTFDVDQGRPRKRVKLTPSTPGDEDLEA